MNLCLVRASFEPGPFDHLLRFFQRTIGQAWIHHSTKNLRRAVGLERLPNLEKSESVIVVANHRSFFDLYVITTELVRRGLRQRVVFMVRSEFFYDSPVGLLVNLCASFLAMYPPIFREKKKAVMNLLAIDELAWLLGRGGLFVGLHPEGRRSRGSDPYQLLSAQVGVGRVIVAAGVPVIPVFVNGLGNSLASQVWGNFNGKGKPVTLVFGKTIDFGDLLEEKSSPRLYRQVSQRCLDVIAELGEEDRLLRSRDDFVM